MNYTLASGSSVHQMVSLIMAAKPLDIIVGQPTMDTMNNMLEQMLTHKRAMNPRNSSLLRRLLAQRGAGVTISLAATRLN